MPGFEALGLEDEIAQWDTLQSASYGNWEPPPPDPVQEYIPQTDPMYAPAQDLSYQQEYIPPAPDPGYGADSSIYAPSPDLSYQQPYTAPEQNAYVAPDQSQPAYTEPMQDPFSQMMYAPAAPDYPQMQGPQQAIPGLPNTEGYDAPWYDPTQMQFATPEWQQEDAQQFWADQPDFGADLFPPMQGSDVARERGFTYDDQGNIVRQDWNLPGTKVVGPVPMGTRFNPNIRLDPSQIQDLRFTPDITSAPGPGALLPDLGNVPPPPVGTPAQHFLDSGGVDPSMYQYFGWNGTGGDKKPFFNNPQFAASNAQFDYTTDPANRGGVGFLGAAGNTLGALNDIRQQQIDPALGFAQDVVGDTFQQAGNYANPYGWNAPTASGYAGSRSSEDNLLGNLARFGAEAQVPGNTVDLALLGGGDAAFQAAGRAIGAGRNAYSAFRAGDEVAPELASLAGRAPSFLENAASAGGDLVNIPRHFPAGVAEQLPRGIEQSGGGGTIDDLAAAMKDIGSRKDAREFLRSSWNGLTDAEIAASVRDYGIEPVMLKDSAVKVSRGKTIDAVMDAAWPLSRNALPESGIASMADNAAEAIPQAVNPAVQALDLTDPQVISDINAGLIPDPRKAEAAVGTATRTLEQVAAAGPGSGARGGQVWPIAGDEFGPKAEAQIKTAVDSFTTDVGKINDGKLNWAVSKLTGDLNDPYANRIAQDGENLFKNVLESAVNDLDQQRKELMKVLTPESAADLVAERYTAVQEALNKAEAAVQIYRKTALEQITDTGARMKANQALVQFDDAVKATKEGILNKVQAAQQPLKQWILGLDIGTVLQQDLRAARMGSVPLGVNAVANVFEKGAQMLGREADPTWFGIFKNSDVMSQAEELASHGLHLHIAQEEGFARSVEQQAADALLQNKLGWKTPFRAVGNAIDKVSGAQFGTLDKLRIQVAKGLLLENKLMGRELTPDVWREVMQYANTAGSSGGKAMAPWRRALEGAIELTPGMTRAQFNEIAQPLKSFTSKTQAVNTANMIGSAAITFFTAYELQDKVLGGPKESFKEFLGHAADVNDPFNFGRMVISDGGGKYRKLDFLPQFSLERAVLKSFADAKKQDILGVAGEFGKYGFGRLNIIPQDLSNLIAGTGYGSGGKFYSSLPGDKNGVMPWAERAKSMAPIPLGVKQMVTEGQTPWNEPRGAAINVLGGNSFQESTYDIRDRAAKEQFGGEFDSLDPVQKAEVYAKMAESGSPPEDYFRNDPYTEVHSLIYQQAGIGDKSEKQARQDFVDEAKAKGASDADAKKYAAAQMKALDDAIEKKRADVIAADPDIVLSDPDSYSQQWRDWAGYQKSIKGK